RHPQEGRRRRAPRDGPPHGRHDRRTAPGGAAAVVRTAALLVLLLALGAEARQEAAAPPDAAGLEFFEQKIRPVLVEKCYSCHSADAKKLKGGLFLDTREGSLKGGDQGPSVIPGDPDKSLLIKAIRYVDQDLKMPPKGKMSDETVSDFVAWVKRGAPDPRAKPVTAKS